MPSKEFHDLMKECIEIHDKKSHDYAFNTNPFSNFEGAAEIVEQFTKPIDQVFAGIIGIKLTRLAQLLNGKIPLNESIDDTFKDAVNYFALWGAYYRSSAKQPTDEKIFELHNKIIDDLGYKPAPITTDVLPIICTNCNKIDPDDAIRHAITMHGAVFNKAQASMRYPTAGLYLLTPTFFKQVKK